MWYISEISSYNFIKIYKIIESIYVLHVLYIFLFLTQTVNLIRVHLNMTLLMSNLVKHILEIYYYYIKIYKIMENNY